MARERANNLIQLKRAIARYLPVAPPSRIRTVEDEPASNYSNIARLIGSTRVSCVYDPYLDDKGLDNFRVLINLTKALAPSVRMITSTKGAKKLSQSYTQAFFSELGCTDGKVRRTSSRKPHRRFMLLTGGQSLVLGMSLNDLNKNEAVSVEDDALDREFFEAEWDSSIPLF